MPRDLWAAFCLHENEQLIQVPHFMFYEIPMKHDTLSRFYLKKKKKLNYEKQTS